MRATMGRTCSFVPVLAIACAVLTIAAILPGGAQPALAQDGEATPPTSDSSLGICGRTLQVRQAILSYAPVDRCEDVTGEHLTNIAPSSSGYAAFIVDGEGLTSLKPGDFDGLTNAWGMYLTDNELETLPDGIFDGLANIESLFLHNNRLESLPDGIFDHNPKLEQLTLANNRLESLPDGIFNHNPNLDYLWAGNNKLESLPDGIFDHNPKLSDLFLEHNDIESLQDDTFARNTELKELWLSYNDISSLAASAFANNAELEVLRLSGNNLSSLPNGIFDNNPKLQKLWLNGNSLSTLPNGIFDNIANLSQLGLADNQLTSLPAELLPDQDEDARYGACLYLSGNRLTDLSDDLLHIASSDLRVVLVLNNNPGAPFAFTMEAELVSETTDSEGMNAAQVRYRVGRGAPVQMTGDLSVSGGTASTSAVTVKGGKVYSDEVTITQSPVGQPVTLTLDGNIGYTDLTCYYTIDGKTRSANFSGVSFNAGPPLKLFEAASTPTPTATSAQNTPATGAPTITGTAQVGQTLTADTSRISDADGLDSVSYSYQWLADDTEIDGATSSTYTLQASDNGKVIKVRVTFTDDAGNEESLPSVGTAAVVLGGL